MKKRIITSFLIMTLAAGLFLMTGCTKEERLARQQQYLDEGKAYLDADNYAAAIDSFNLSLEQCLGKATIREIEIDYYKAAAQYLSGDFEGAMETYSAIVEYDDTLSAPYFLRGSMKLQQELIPEAIADYKKAGERSGGDYEMYIEIYQNLRAVDQEKAGLEFLNTALAISDKSAYASLQRGRIYLLMEQYDLAEGELTNARSKGMDEAAVYLAEVFKATNRDDQASSILQEYIDEGAAGSEAYNTMGLLYLGDKEYSRALNCFEKGLECERVSNEQSLLRNRIIVLEYLGRFEEAKRAMNDYLILYPKDEEAAREAVFLSTRGVFIEPPAPEPEPEEASEEGSEGETPQN